MCDSHRAGEVGPKLNIKCSGLKPIWVFTVPRVDSMTTMLEGVEPVSGENTNGEDAILSQTLECSTRPTGCPQAEVHFSHMTQQS
jgi:hypothetical protein